MTDALFLALPVVLLAAVAFVAGQALEARRQRIRTRRLIDRIQETLDDV